MKKSIFICSILLINLVSAQARNVCGKQSHGNGITVPTQWLQMRRERLCGRFIDGDSVIFGAIKLVNPDSFTTKIFLVSMIRSGTVIWAKTFAAI